ncbi:Uncharacterized protein SCF082_LOCUS43791 [Durusdinium trenchii]|uniref:Uncharacterized protein n=1 Tax=Durusdinium trenchii TaxID=1381693 RepID=A0ABP0QYQ9_9DINO
MPRMPRVTYPRGPLRGLLVLSALMAGLAFIPGKATRGCQAAGLSGLAAGASCAGAAGAEAMPMAPSGVNALPEAQQAQVVLAIFGALALFTYVLVGPIFQFLQKILPEGWFKGWQKTWPILGAFYMAAGVAHFTAAEAFEAIYPPMGTWGFWYLPGSASFHVAWTGVAELLGGTGLFVGALLWGLAGALQWELPAAVKRLPALSALGLCALTCAVTPANVYMYTHGAQMVGLTPGDQPIPVEFHLIRGLLQVVLLGLLWSYSRAAWEEAEASSGAR